jgi:alpha-D-xyloside xylohydrolase
MKKICAIFLFITTHLFTTAQSYQKTDLGLKTTINAIDIEIQFLNNDIIRVLKSPVGSTFIKKSFSVIKTPGKVDIQIKQSVNSIKVSGNTLNLSINLKSGQIRFFSKTDKVLLAEKESGTSFVRSKDSLEKSLVVSQSFQLTPDEAIYGLGQHQKGSMNQRNQRLTLKQANMQIAIPYFYSTNGYGLFWDNSSSTIFEDKPAGTSFESESGNCVDYYFLRSDDANKGLAAWRELTGQAPMYPRWLFGYWQSRERYKGQTELIDVIKKYRALNVPLDGIVQDWQYWGSGNQVWNSTEFGNPLFPNPKQMIDSVHELNAHIIISVWPSFGIKTKIFNEFKQNGMLLDLVTWPITPDVQVYDAFNPKARDIYWRYMNQNIFSLGMDGWWLDATEPEQMNPKSTGSENKTYLGAFSSVGNAFPLQTTLGVYEHQRKVTSNKRVFILTRSAFAGQQRNATTTWSGDIFGRWDVLHNQIANGLNMSMSGIPYWNSDIGGFFTGKRYPLGVKDPAYQELYVRWLQFAAFCPMFRSHGTDTPREIYQFGQKGYWAFDAIEKFINLRYRLLPYIYSTSWDVTSQASTFMRPLVMDFPNDKKVYDINNEYLFGKSILVCPVTDSMYTIENGKTTQTNFEKAKTHKVYLPAGSSWFDFWTGKKLTGGQDIQREAPIDIMPLYVKAGSILPMGSLRQYSNERDDSQLELRIYPGADAVFTLYEDENDNYNYEKGIYAVITFKWDDAIQKLTIEDRKGNFPGMVKNRTFNIVKIDQKSGLGIPPVLKPNAIINYNGKKIVVKL